ncbi:hypothetical protein R1sor_006640 [Riccia sorocarpa]|uniref:Uncharacterized protein n=1 Tax=Riccia sorocarpa TaxID=122646 RepID=A0ABD3HUF0_9MARC
MSRSVHLFQMIRADTELVSMGLIGFKDGDTLAAFRSKLETTGLFSSFQFWDGRVSSAVHPKLESIIFVEEFDGRVIVFEASEFPTSSQKDSSASVIPGSANGDSIDPNTQCSTLEVNIVDKLIKWTEKNKKTDLHWRVKTWDEESIVCGVLECLECQSTQGKSQGSEDKMAIVNLFLNFRTKHLNSEKHKVNWCRRRRIDTSSMPAKTSADDTDHRAETDLGLEIVQRINDEEDAERKPFVVEGDVNREPCYSWIYRVRCVLCGSKFELVPAKKNLEHNLRQHLCSEKHRERMDVDMSLKGGIRTGGKGRPKRSDPRDMKRQRCIETFFGGSRRAADDQDSTSMSLSSPLTLPNSKNTEGTPSVFGFLNYEEASRTSDVLIVFISFSQRVSG